MTFYVSPDGNDAWSGRLERPVADRTDGQVTGLLCMGAVKLCEPADDARTVREVLQFAVEHAGSKGKPDDLYWAGLHGYDQWVRALESGEAGDWGVPYNAACYLECRQHAVAFLTAARDRLNGGLAPLLDEAIKQYQAVVGNLEQVTAAFPSKDHKPEHVKDEERIRRATGALRQAKQAEAEGAAALQEIVNALGSLEGAEP